jgi:hypothetical protein
MRAVHKFDASCGCVQAAYRVVLAARFADTLWDDKRSPQTAHMPQDVPSCGVDSLSALAFVLVADDCLLSEHQRNL